MWWALGDSGHRGWGKAPTPAWAKLGMQALLRAMVARVARVTAGEPTPLVNNTLQGIAALPAAFEPAGARTPARPTP